MKSSIFAFLFAAAALVGLALPTPAAAATEFEKFQKSLNNRSPKNTMCVCTGGKLNRITGFIGTFEKEDANGVFIEAACYAAYFDKTTGENDDLEPCDATWMPLPR